MNFIKKVVGKQKGSTSSCCGVDIKEVQDNSESCCDTDSITDSSNSCCGTESAASSDNSCCG